MKKKIRLSEGELRKVIREANLMLGEGIEEDDGQESIKPVIDKISLVLEEQSNNFKDELIEKYGEDYSQWPVNDENHDEDFWHETKDVNMDIAEDMPYGTWKGNVKFKLWIEPYFGYAPEDCSIYAEYIGSNIFLERDGQTMPYNGDGNLTPEDLSDLEDALIKNYDFPCSLSINGKPLWKFDNEDIKPF